MSTHTLNPPGGDDGRFLTVADFAALVRQSPHTVAKWCRRGGSDFPRHIRLPNGRVLIEAAAAENWLRERTS